ncbi:cleavage and polyadenylation specificity factor subunit 6-like isoform X2 [Boleophthalmus pectinirostris]|uniref:cleavage and polyadenylation specificity factor subunit 6-like isoform X2 n=1 Tax=Boleophthalmus pectinirostris TaxID=150288 RepID=UPI00242B5865|nr:cleavage and polyadenylation specificity factor subunit 6-like isoform X2 [Boleophthalmus pectinirostris]
MTAAQPAAKELDLNDEDDLFDAVLTGSVDKDKTLPSTQSKTEVKTDNNAKFNPPETSKLTPPSKKLGLYLGKFPWWVTEEDVLRLVNNLGVRDVTEVKFAENKVNGLSKGYVKVMVSSEDSMKLLLDKVPKCSLGGEKIICRYANNFNLSLFEDMAKQSVPGFPPRARSYNMNDSGSSFLPQNPFDSTVPQQFFHPFANTADSAPNPFLSYPPPPLPYMPPPPFMFLNFMNPPANPPQDQNANVETAGTSQEGHSSSTLNRDEKTDKGFEELINRNRAVASTAISKAVSGATTGDLRVAMETLLTAISIIKQSRVYQDDRCQAMVTSLKDCLVSIQGSYGFSRHSEEKERDRRKSSSKERRRSSRGDRDRSRSSERSSHSKERSRERDRYRDRDRDRYY